MSIDVHRSIFPVYVAPRETAGPSQGDLEYIFQELTQGSKRHPGIEEAINHILLNAHKDYEVVEEMKRRGVYLLGIQAVKGDALNVGGLLYAEADGGDQETGYAEVDVDMWMSWTRLAHESESEQKHLLDSAFIDLDDNEDDARYSIQIPVRRLTRISPLVDVIEGSSHPEGYIFGHDQDLRAIGQLAVPQSLKSELQQTAIIWQSLELQRAQLERV